MTYIDPTAKLLHHIDRIAQIDAGHVAPPVNAEIDLSNRCNLGCKGCHMAQLHTRGPHASKAMIDAGDMMKTSLAMEIVRQLTEYGVRSITWTGGGEPLIHPDCLDIFAGCNIDQGLYTNGTLIDPLKATVLKQVMKWVYVSLDRHTRESYKDYKQADKFDSAVNGIKALVRASGPATIGVGYLLDADNWHEATDMYRFAVGLGVDYVQFRPLVVPGSDTAWVYSFLDHVEDVTGLDKCIIDTNRFVMLANWQGHEYPMCYWSQMQAVITPDAKVWTCVNRRGFEGDYLGSLVTSPFPAVWARSGAKKVDEKCRMLCRGHIPNMALDKMIGKRPDHWRFI